MLSTSIERIKNGHNLTESEMMTCMDLIMSGQESEVLVASFLTALAMKGESIQEITGGVKILRNKALQVNLDEYFTVDTCGTGGDQRGTYNISTAVSFIVAAAGIKVVKHGNRSVSSLSGSADVLEALGININLLPHQVEKCVRDIGIGFLYAPIYHNAMKYVAPVRKTLGFRTIFNIFGPLVNPAKASAQVMGVFNKELTNPLAEVLRNLGVKRAMVIHGMDGLDEISIASTTKISELKDEIITSYMVTPEQFGFNRCDLEDIKGGSAAENATIIFDLFKGMRGPKRDVLLLNAGAAIYVGNKAKSLKEGIKVAEIIIDNHLAMEKLLQFKEMSNFFADAE